MSVTRGGRACLEEESEEEEEEEEDDVKAKAEEVCGNLGFYYY